MQRRCEASGIENGNAAKKKLVLKDCMEQFLSYLSSFARSFDSRRLSPAGNGGGEDDGPGDVDFRRDDRREPFEGVL